MNAEPYINLFGGIILLGLACYLTYLTVMDPEWNKYRYGLLTGSIVCFIFGLLRTKEGIKLLREEKLNKVVPEQVRITNHMMELVSLRTSRYTTPSISPTPSPKVKLE